MRYLHWKCFGCFLICIILFAILPWPSPAQQPGGSGPCEGALKESEALSAGEKFDEAIKFLGVIIDNPACPSGVKCDAYFGRGKAKEKNQDLSGAIADYDKALQCRPQSNAYRTTLANAYLKRGNLRERLGDLRGGPADFEKALQYDSDLPDAKASLSNIYFKWGSEKENRGDLNRAMEDYKKALQYNPHNSEASEAMSNVKEKKRHKSQQRDALFTF